MALLYWLPLITDTHNQGLTGVTFTNNNVTFGEAGKLGASAVFNGSNSVIYADGVTVGDIWTVCWWAKASTSHNGYMFQLGSAAVSSKVQAAMRTSNLDSGTDTFLVLADKAGPTITVDGINYLEWNHYAIAYDGVDLKIYINGTLRYTDTRTRVYYSGERLSIGNYYSSNYFNGMIQDFRIYDTALSPREIKLLSQGLVAHWTLSGPGENIALNTATPLTTAASSDGSVYTGYYYLSVPVGSFTTEDVLTISFDFEVTGNSATNANVYPQFNNAMPSGLVSYPLTGKSPERGRFIFTFSPTQTQADYNQVRVRFRLRNASDGAVLKVTNSKLEYSDHATPWSPAPADPEYSAMGYDDNIEYDVSGYGNNGVRSGTFSYSSDAPKYTTSTVFDGNSAIQCPKYFEVEYMNQVTFSCWANCDWDDGKHHYFISSQQTGGLLLFQHSAGFIRARTYRYASADYSDRGYWQADYTPDEPLSSGWHMFTGVHDSNSIKLYIDGELMKTTEGVNYGIHFHPTANMYIGAEADPTAFSTPVTGKISDVRIYATALTADEIADLYHTPISVSNTGTLLTQGELQE